jgi:hypothetical protein
MLSIARAAAAASFVVVAAFANGSTANDTMAEFGAGGLRFERTDELRMEREDLFLSPDEVRVFYVIRNLTTHDVRGTVAFPMPDIDVGAMSQTPHDFHRSTNDGDIFDFHVEVDGRPIVPGFEARAVLSSGKDVTDFLKRHHVLLVDPDHVNLEPERVKPLTAAGVLDDGDDHYPAWTVKPVYHWDQVFPAGRELSITHRYKPVLGGTTLSLDPRFFRLDPRFFRQESFKDAQSSDGAYCPDDAFIRAVKKLPSRPSEQTVQTRWLEYVLKTGANWAGPIGRFHLEIGKAKSDLLSLCAIPGLKVERRGRSFVAEAANYVPTSNIKILFVYGCGRLQLFPCR